MSKDNKQQIPQQIRKQVHQVISLLLMHGLQYEATLLESEKNYDFLYPKSKYYRYYTHELYQHGPTSREKMEANIEKDLNQYIKIEGNLENISVGAMVEIIKNQLAETNREPYQPFQDQYYDESVKLAQRNENIASKISELIQKYTPLIKKKGQEKEKQKEKKASRSQEARKEAGMYNDGSLGAYGGRKYEGLGARDQFDAFRREKSQSYYSNLQDKSK